MIQPGRRVRTLKLRVTDKGTLARGQRLVSEALSAASLPGIPSRGLYLVRRLDLGTFPAAGSPLALARRIDRLVTGAVALGDGGACTPATPDQPGAEAVWFADEVAPLVALAGAIARGESVRAWYWRVAVPHWSPGADAGTALRQLLHAAHQTPAGAFSAARVLQRLLDDGREDTLLSVLTAADASAFLAEAGWQPRDPVARATDDQRGATTGKAEPAGRLHPAWRASLVRWLRAWPSSDPRAEWLSRLALLRANPARAMVTAGPPVAGGLAYALGLRGPAPVPPPATTVRPGGPRAATARSDGQSHATTQGTGSVPDGRPASGRTVPESSRTGAGAPDWDVPAPPASPGAEATPPRDAPMPAPRGTRVTAPGPVPSPNAGFILLVQVLKLIGMDAILVVSPDLAEHNLPGRVLSGLAARVGLTDRDPAYAVLGNAPAPGPPEPISFVAPPAWSPLLSGGDPDPGPRVLAPGGSPGRRVLVEPRARLLLGCWTAGARPPGMSGWLRGRLRRDRGHREDGVDAVCGAVQLAAGRYLRRHAGISLRRLVRRPGLVASTPTHLDVWFDERLVDMGLRRSGVDFDPGWVPWLGRVVTVHYGRGQDTRES